MTTGNAAQERIHALLRRFDVLFVQDVVAIISETEREQLKADLIETGVQPMRVRALFEPIETLEALSRSLIDRGDLP